jgi:hypothetical protein
MFAQDTAWEDWLLFISGIQSRINAELLHASKKGCTIHAHACGSSIGPSNLSLALGECAHDLLALLLSMIVDNTPFAI